MSDSDLKSPMLAERQNAKMANVPIDSMFYRSRRVSNRFIEWLTSGNRATWDWRHWFMCACGMVLALVLFTLGYHGFFNTVTFVNVASYITAICVISTFAYCVISVDQD